MSAQSDYSAALNNARGIDSMRAVLTGNTSGSYFKSTCSTVVAHDSLLQQPIRGLKPLEHLRGHCFKVFFEQRGSDKGVCGVSIASSYGMFETALCNQNETLVYSPALGYSDVSRFHTLAKLRQELNRLVGLVSTYSQSPDEKLRQIVNCPSEEMD